MPLNPVQIGGNGVKTVTVGKGQPLTIIAGPCVIESREQALQHAASIQSIVSEVGLPFVFKASYDKANRTSAQAFRGPGLEEGLAILQEIRREFSLPVLTDVHSPEEAREAAKIVDIVQVPAFLCRQTDLLFAAGACGKTVLVKKGQFLAPGDMRFVVEKVTASGNQQVLLCERGACFGYRELVVDFRSLQLMREFQCPVVFDATHSVQVMGGADGKSSGNRGYVNALARAAVAVGIDALFLECHKNPAQAPSDGPNMLPLAELGPLLRDLRTLQETKLETR